MFFEEPLSHQSYVENRTFESFITEALSYLRQQKLDYIVTGKHSK